MPIMLIAALAALGADDGKCLDAIDHRGFVKSQMLECATTDMDRADKALNAAYAATMARLAPAARTRLRGEERRWIDERRARCRVEVQNAIPSPEINRMNCLVRETDKRTAVLRAIR